MVVVLFPLLPRCLSYPLQTHPDELCQAPLLIVELATPQVGFAIEWLKEIIFKCIIFTRYFKRNENSQKIKSYIHDCSRGDWFVLYQLSKNLNRAFFMDFLVTLSRIIEEEKKNPGIRDMDCGDGIMDMMLKPTLATYESKDEKKKDTDDDDDDD